MEVWLWIPMDLIKCLWFTPSAPLQLWHVFSVQRPSTGRNKKIHLSQLSSWKLHKYNAHHMNHPWWSSHLDFNSMLRRRSRGWWHCHDLRFLCEGGRLSEATISSYNLRNTTIHMLHNIAYMNMCFFSPKHSGNPYMSLPFFWWFGRITRQQG